MNNYFENQCNSCNYKDRPENFDNNQFNKNNFEKKEISENFEDYSNQLHNKNDFDKKDLIKNKSSIEVEGCNKKFVFESNEVEAKKVKIRIKEEQSCRLAFEDEIIEYKVKICNDSDVKLFNCEFKDFLDRNTEYKKDSFKVNGKCETPCVKDNVISFVIPELKDNHETVIVFDAKVK